MKQFDPYKILGITPEADLTEIRRAFREKARRYHPDVGGEMDLFVTLKRCYEELCRRHTPCNRLQIVKKPPEGGDYLLSFLDLSVRELALGATISVMVPDKPISCPRCQGRGVDPAGKTEICPICQGKGLLHSGGRDTPCPRCRGEGRLLVDLCPTCRGRGELLGEKEMRLVVPQGVRPGDILYLPSTPEGPCIDVYFEIQLHSEGDLTFEGNQVVSRVQIPFWKAALGGRVKVQTLEGQEMIEIPPGLQHGTVMIIPNRGAYRTDGSREDLLIKFEIVFPRNLSPEAKNLLRKLAELLEKEEEYECTC